MLLASYIAIRAGKMNERSEPFPSCLQVNIDKSVKVTRDAGGRLYAITKKQWYTRTRHKKHEGTSRDGSTLTNFVHKWPQQEKKEMFQSKTKYRIIT